MSLDAAGRRLDELRSRREELREEQRSTSTQLAVAMREALEAGMPLAEVARRLDISRQGAYKLLDR